MTIVQAIQYILQESHLPLSVDEIHRQITDRGLYPFLAADPKSVVRGQLRRHCVGLNFASASPVKYFSLVVLLRPLS